MTEPRRHAFPPDIQDLLDQPRETRSVEHKGQVEWASIRLKLIRAVLAMSNLADGGHIVVGVSSGASGLEASGLSREQYDSFNEDVINDQVRRFADPPFAVAMTKGLHADRLFVVLRVPPFAEIPTICRADDGPTSELRAGAIYTRSIHKPETTEVRSQNEMREIIQRAVDLGVRDLLTRFPELGSRSSRASEAFGRERGSFD
jgi:predicted HTH transcriptional regulator